MRSVRARRRLGAGGDSCSSEHSQRIRWGRTLPASKTLACIGGRGRKQFVFSAFSELWHSLFVWISPFQVKRKSTEKVSWEIPTSSILWHRPSEISRIKVVGKSSGPSGAPSSASPSSELGGFPELPKAPRDQHSLSRPLLSSVLFPRCPQDPCTP